MSASSSPTLQFANPHLSGVPVLRADPAKTDNASKEQERDGQDWRKRSTKATPGVCYSEAEPTAINNPILVGASPSALGLFLPREGDAPVSEELIDLFSGSPESNQRFGVEATAHCYCGHQFGNFSGQLGDGRAISLGSVPANIGAPDDSNTGKPKEALDLGWFWRHGSWEELGSSTDAVPARGGRWELQLKGAGPTVYSRESDGRAVLRSSVREFLASEFMHALGIPTTRAATLVVSSSTSDSPQTTVIRDKNYDGNAAAEPCAVVLRTARCFVRFGSFQIANDTDPVTGRRGPSAGNPLPVIALFRNVCEQYFPALLTQGPIPDDGSQDPKLAAGLFREVCERTARLVAMWQSVGFCHGKCFWH
jgi:protein adenylyltransferase